MTIPGFATTNTQAQNQAALQAQIAATGYAEIPPGVYQCALSMTDVNACIVGSGVGVTILMTSGASAFAFNNSASPRHVTIDNLSIRSRDAYQFDGIDIIGSHAGVGNIYKQIDIGRVELQGDDAVGTHGWKRNIRLRDVSNGNLHDFYSWNEGGTEGAHVQLEGQCLNNGISSASWYGACFAGLRAIGSANEGVQMTGVTILSAQHGVRWTGGGVYLSCIGCDFDTTVTGISGDVSQSKIVGNLFYAARANDIRCIDLTNNNHTITGNTFLKPTPVTTTWGVYLTNSSLCAITGNTFQSINTGIVVLKTGGYADANIINGNAHFLGATDIYIGPGVTNTFTSGNTGNGTTQYGDASGNATNAHLVKTYGSKTIAVS